MECKKCNKTISSDSKFCVYCGEKVDKEKSKLEREQQKEEDFPSIISDIRNHIGFMGYELTDSQAEDNGIIRFLATNKNRTNLLISYFPSINALLFIANFSIPEADSEQKKHELLEVTNQVNSDQAMITTLSVGKNYDSISFSSWYPDIYSKKDFSNFLEIYQNEMSRLSTFEGLQAFI